MKLAGRTIEAAHQVIDEMRLPAMEIKLKAGRNISSAFPSDKKHAVLVNEAFVQAAGLKDPIGTTMETSDYFDTELKTIVGVIEDYHSGPLHRAIPPMVMLACDWFSGSIWIKIDKAQQQKAIAAIEAAYKKAMPAANFQYNFLDALNAKEYLQEQRWQKIITIATFISIFVCCIGLFALARLAAQQRIKEIGIRKVLGASVQNIVALLSKDFFKLVIVALVLSAPLAGYTMHRWLQDFAYRVNIGWWIFFLAGGLALVIALFTVSLQAIKAAVANPVKSLRTE